MPGIGPRPDHLHARDELPRELVAALASAPEAQAQFDALAPSHR
ncbi:MAG: hypothetical protein JWN41_671, partial [Thermoleophilia bacterium]|nr:hypothetical protein [Thermoleophilia bacterium]